MLPCSYNGKTNKILKNFKNPDLLPAVVAFYHFLCKKGAYGADNDIPHLFKVVCLPSKRTSGTSRLRLFLPFPLQDSSWFRFLFLTWVCLLGAKTLAFTIPHCVCFVVFCFCWCSNMFSVRSVLQAHYPAWQKQRATRISWGETSRCRVWDFSSPNYINYIISLKQHSKWNHSLKVLHTVQLSGLL